MSQSGEISPNTVPLGLVRKSTFEMVMDSQKCSPADVKRRIESENIFFLQLTRASEAAPAPPKNAPLKSAKKSPSSLSSNRLFVTLTTILVNVGDALFLIVY